MKSAAALLLAALVLVPAAAAAAPKGMATAMRALHYPKSGARTLKCRHAGTGFNCKATYRHHRVRRFYAEWQTMGGWICAGRKPATCKTLRHGFIPTSEASDPHFAAEQAARGYMTLKYQDPQPFAAGGTCTQPTRPSTWSFCYALDTGNINVTVHLAKAKTGYVTTVSGTLYS